MDMDMAVDMNVDNHMDMAVDADARRVDGLTG